MRGFSTGCRPTPLPGVVGTVVRATSSSFDVAHAAPSFQQRIVSAAAVVHAVVVVVAAFVLTQHGNDKSPFFNHDGQSCTLKDIVHGMQGIIKQIEFAVDQYAQIHRQ